MYEKSEWDINSCKNKRGRWRERRKEWIGLIHWFHHIIWEYHHHHTLLMSYVITPTCAASGELSLWGQTQILNEQKIRIQTPAIYLRILYILFWEVKYRITNRLANKQFDIRHLSTSFQEYCLLEIWYMFCIECTKFVCTYFR